jgi:hypothetical protein
MNKYHLEALNALAALIHDRNIRAGFYDPERVRGFDGMMMNAVTELAEAQEEWRAGRGYTETYWKIKQAPAALMQQFKEINGRLYVRNYNYDFDASEDEWLEMTPLLLRAMPNLTKHLQPEGIPTELADAIIRILDVCAYHKIDIAAAVADKMAYNETREHRHGGKLS